LSTHVIEYTFFEEDQVSRRDEDRLAVVLETDLRMEGELPDFVYGELGELPDFENDEMVPTAARIEQIGRIVSEFVNTEREEVLRAIGLDGTEDMRLVDVLNEFDDMGSAFYEDMLPDFEDMDPKVLEGA
jgi:hypothetical protein